MNAILQKRIEEKSKGLAQKYFPNEMNIWARLNYEAQYVESACKEIADFALQKQWISVEEALPEKNTMCFVRKETEVGVIYDTDYIDYEGKWFFNSNRISIQSMVVTHWMSIPSLEGGEK